MRYFDILYCQVFVLETDGGWTISTCYIIKFYAYLECSHHRMTYEFLLVSIPHWSKFSWFRNPEFFFIQLCFILFALTRYEI
jgi:hypothetical protein